MSALIHFGIDGWRARADEGFTEENVARVALAAARFWREQRPAEEGRTVYVGYDAREAAEPMARLAAEVIAGYGFRVMLSDRYCPTAAVSWVTSRDVEACGALIVTGGQKPYDFCGIKIRDAEGGVGLPGWSDDVESLIEGEEPLERGSFELLDIVTPYLDAIIGEVDVEAIREAGIRVVCDPLYGAGRGYLSELLERLGIAVIEIHGFDEPEMDEVRPEPVEPWADDCEQAVVEVGARMGLIVDGDAERVAAVDETGRFICPQKIFTLLLGHLVRDRGQKGRVVVEQSSTTLVRRLSRDLGIRLTVRPVGFKYLYEQMAKGDVLLCGEDIGGMCVPGHAPERDGIFAAVLLCEMVAQTGKTLAQLVAEVEGRYGAFAYARREVRLEPEVVESLRTMLPGMNPREVAGGAPAAVSHMDGLRLEFEDESWLLLRPSGTESLVRVYAEAGTIERRDKLLEAGSSIAHGDLM